MKSDLESLKRKAKGPDDKNNEEFKPITAKKRNITSNLECTATIAFSAEKMSTFMQILLDRET